MSVRTKNFTSSTSEAQEFIVDGKKGYIYFGISYASAIKVGKPPLELHSVMYFMFEKTNDYAFIFRLWHIAKRFIQYLCYRKNINLKNTELSAPVRDRKREKFATLIVSEEADSEPEILEKNMYIKQEYISGFEGKILSDIAGNRIYMRHIPETYKRGRTIDAARFVMITAAFEWTFKKNYTNGVVKKPATIEAENNAATTLDQLVKNSTGKEKEIYKFLKKLIGSDSLESEIEQTGKDYADIVDVFGKRLYSINKKTLWYREMGQRLSKQRNNYAHGNLDKDIIGLSILDLMYLEYIIYAMQLKEYGIDKVSIQRAINELFSCSIAI
ncbi:MAG: hypothetical protein Q4D58_06010 [Synergistaceae bacterium]|nr:hypothetical protein [Synergistaceae bacterium]